MMDLENNKLLVDKDGTFNLVLVGHTLYVYARKQVYAVKAKEKRSERVHNDKKMKRSKEKEEEEEEVINL